MSFNNKHDFNDQYKLALLCPHCFNINGYIKYNNSFQIESNITSFGVEQHTEYYVDGYCSHCGEFVPEFIIIDNGLSNIIKILNQKGIQTLFCCDGLHKTNVFSHSVSAYICFTSTRYLPFLDPLPDGWYFDHSALSKSNLVTMRAFSPKYDILELEDWALSRKEVKEEDLEFVDIEQYFNDGNWAICKINHKEDEKNK